MNILLHQLFGTWRNTDGKMLTDFNIHQFGNNYDLARSMFTIYNSENNEIFYEWHGKFSINNYPDSISEISLDEMFKTADKPEYENLKIWAIDDIQMIIQLGDGTRLIFNKLGS